MRGSNEKISKEWWKKELNFVTHEGTNCTPATLRYG